MTREEEREGYIRPKKEGVGPNQKNMKKTCVKTKQDSARQVGVWQGRAGQAGEGQLNAQQKQSRADWGRAWRAGQGRAGQGRAGQGRAGQAGQGNEQ